MKRGLQVFGTILGTLLLGAVLFFVGKFGASVGGGPQTIRTWNRP